MGLLKTRVLNVNGNLKKELMVFIQEFDGDFSGDNGDDYMDEEAVENGYESSTEYFFDKAIARGDTPFEAVKDVMYELWITYDNDNYGGSDYSVIDLGNQIVVSFTCH